MVQFKYRVRARVISIVEFGWSVFVLVYIMIHFKEFLNYIKDPALNGVFITTLVTSITSSILQFISSILLSFGSIGIEIVRDDVPTLMRFIEKWDMLTGWRICLLLPSAFFPPLTIIKTSELLLSVVNVFIVYDYLLELQDNMDEQRYPPASTYTGRIGRSRFEGLFSRTRRIDGIRDAHDASQSTIIAIHGSTSLPPPAYEPPPTYDEVVEKSNCIMTINKDMQ